MDKRLFALSAWVNRELGAVDVALTPASADASFRRYFRLRHENRTYIAMDAPPERENTRLFVDTAACFRGLGLNVPEILAHRDDQGFALLSDLGTRLYLPNLNQDTVERLYGDALDALAVLQTGTSTDPGRFPPYSRDVLMQEMAMFREWYVPRHLNASLTDQQVRHIDAAFAALCDSALEQPQVWVHRDFHSRNLMVTPHNNPGILDFQDALTGPVTYDLVSLLKDCYVRWPRERVVHWVQGYFKRARGSQIPVGEDPQKFLEWFDRMGIQRHIKVLGIFARLFHRDGKPDYLADLPRVWEYVVDACDRYPDLADLHELMLTLPPPPCTR